MSTTKEYAKEVREWRKEHGMCVRCGKEKAYKNRVSCLQCLMDQREYARERYEGPSEDKRLKAKELRDYKKAHGICRQCSKKVYRNHAYCYEHYLSQKRAHEKHARERYNYYGEVGLCRICGKPRYENHRLCKEHYEAQAERMRNFNRERAENRERLLQEQYKLFHQNGKFRGRKPILDKFGVRVKTIEFWELDEIIHKVTIKNGVVRSVVKC